MEVPLDVSSLPLHNLCGKQMVEAEEFLVLLANASLDDES
jgi:hypothetical protein